MRLEENAARQFLFSTPLLLDRTFLIGDADLIATSQSQDRAFWPRATRLATVRQQITTQLQLRRRGAHEMILTISFNTRETIGGTEEDEDEDGEESTIGDVNAGSRAGSAAFSVRGQLEISQRLLVLKQARFP